MKIEVTTEELELLENHRKRTKSPEQAAMSLIGAIEAERLNREIEVADLARKSGLQTTQLRHILSGKTDPKLTTLFKIASSLELNLIIES